MTDDHIPKYSRAVFNEINLKNVVERYGRENCYFGKLWEGFNFTEPQIIFSYAVSKFQHLINFENL